MSTTRIKRFTLPALRRYLASKPARTWNSGSRVDTHGTRCVLGHLDKMTGEHVGPSSPILTPFERLVTPVTPYGTPDWALAEVNNGTDSRYQQKTPRARVLAAIDDLVARKVSKTP